MKLNRKIGLKISEITTRNDEKLWSFMSQYHMFKPHRLNKANAAQKTMDL